MAHLLLIEDDAAIRTNLLRALRDRGHAVAASHTAMDGLGMLARSMTADPRRARLSPS